MSSILFRKINKRSWKELECAASEIIGLTIELTEYTHDTLKFVREILTHISRIAGPFWFHIPNSILEEAYYDILRLFTAISENLNFFYDSVSDEIIRELPNNYVVDILDELRSVINSKIGGIIIKIRNESNNIKDEILNEKIYKSIDYAIIILLDLKIELKKGIRKIASLYVRD